MPNVDEYISLDTISAASYAAFKGIPIVLSSKESISKDAAEYLKKNSITKTNIIGGEGAIGQGVLSSVVNGERIYGRDRYETNMAFLDRFKDKFSMDKVYLATGEDFPDALSGSALASMSGSPIILIDGTQNASTYNYIIQNKDKMKDKYILGGSGAIPEFFLNKLFW